MAAVALGGCSLDDGTGAPDSAPAAGGEEDRAPLASLTAGDLDLFAFAVRVEHTLVGAYDGLLGERAEELAAAGAQPLLARCRDHHADHARRLNALLATNGTGPVPSGDRYDRAVVAEGDLLREEPLDELLLLARDLEDAAAQTYLTTVPRLSIPEIRQVAAAIATVEARHVTAHDVLAAAGASGYSAAAIVGGNYPIAASYLAG